MAGKKYLKIGTNNVTEGNSVQTTADSPAAGDIVALNSSLKVDSTLLPAGLGGGASTLTDSTGSNTANVVSGGLLQVEDARNRKMLDEIYQQLDRQADLTAEMVKIASYLKSFNWAGVWDSSVNYNINDVVTYQGATYIATAANNNQTPSSTSTYWNALLNQGTIPNYNTKLAADINLTINVWTDALSLTLGAGTWLVMGSVTTYNPTNQSGVGARLFDGTTTYASSNEDINVGTAGPTIPVSAVITLTATTTIKLQGINNADAGVIKATIRQNATGNNATQMTAVMLSSGATGTINGLQSLSTILSANITLPANTFTDALSLTLGAGTWLVTGNCSVQNTTQAAGAGARLFDGTNTYASGSEELYTTTAQSSIPVSAVISLTAATKITLQGNCNTTGGLITANIRQNSTGNNATTLIAIQLAAGTSAATLNSASAVLANSVGLTNGVWSDVLSLSLSAGTWLVNAQADIYWGSGTLTEAGIRITDGTTAYSATEIVNSYGGSSACSALITLSAQTTIKMQATCSNATSTVNVVIGAQNLIAGTTGITQINAIKVS